VRDDDAAFKEATRRSSHRKYSVAGGAVLQAGECNSMGKFRASRCRNVQSCRRLCTLKPTALT
jgi:hypothetical protein